MVYSGVFERFFLLGIKKVILSSAQWSKFDLLKRNYPCIDKTLFPALPSGEEGEEHLFFYDEELKEEIYLKYIKGNEHIKPYTEEYHRLLGTILGFPPKAVDFFSSGEHEKQPHKKVFLQFCGVQCVASIDNLVEDVEWLWEKYPYPESDILIAKYKYDYVDFTYGDIKAVKEAQQHGLAYIEKQLEKEVKKIGKGFSLDD